MKWIYPILMFAFIITICGCDGHSNIKEVVLDADSALWMRLYIIEDTEAREIITRMHNEVRRAYGFWGHRHDWSFKDGVPHYVNAINNFRHLHHHLSDKTCQDIWKLIHIQEMMGRRLSTINLYRSRFNGL